MRNILLIIKHNLTMYNKSKEIIIFFLLPLVVTIVSFTLAKSNVPSKIDIGFINSDVSSVSKDMEERVLSKYNLYIGSQSEIEEKVSKGKVEAAIKIENKNLKNDILKGEKIKVKIITIKENELTNMLSQQINTAIGAYTSIGILSGKSEKNFDEKLKNYINTKIEVKNEKLSKDEVDMQLLKTSLGMYTMFSIIIAIMLLSVLLKEKKINTYKRICISPVKEREYILGCAGACYLMLIVQMLLQLIAYKFMNIQIDFSYINMFIIMMFMGLFAVSFGMLLLVFSPTAEAMGILGAILLMPLIIISGTVPLEFLPSSVEKIAVIFPIKWAVDGYNSILKGESIFNLGLNVFIIVAFSMILLLIAKIKMEKSEAGKHYI